MRYLLLVACLVLPMPVHADVIKSTGFLDPQDNSSGVVSWFGGTTLDTSAVGSASFTLDSAALIESIDLWIYDTTDGSRAALQEIGDEFSSDAPTLTASEITSRVPPTSTPLAGHTSTNTVGAGNHTLC